MASLDHIVVNVLHEMEAAAASFSALGFQLTPLGRHSLGSINHLAMTSGPYLELVGVPDTGLQRQEVLDSPPGLNGLVLASTDADATYQKLKAAGLPAALPVAFSRPVEIKGCAAEARFRTVRLSPELFPAGRVYFCEHRTPDLVWREPWFAHANGFCEIDGLVIASRDPVGEAARYAAVFETSVERLGPESARVRLGAFRVDIVVGPQPRFESLGLRFTSLDEVERRAGKLTNVRWTRHAPERATLELSDFDLRLTCSGP